MSLKQQAALLCTSEFSDLERIQNRNEQQQARLDQLKPIRARIISASGPGASAFLVAVPNEFFGTQMQPADFQLAVQLRLGCIQINPNQHCANCAAALDSAGHHATSCRSGTYRNVRHRDLLDEISIKASKAQLGGAKEFQLPNGQQRLDLLLRPERGGRNVGLDISVINPCAQSYITRAARASLGAAAIREREKNTKYEASCRDARISFSPVVFETYGAIGKEGMSVIGRIIKALIRRDPQAPEDAFKSQKRWFLQRLSVNLQTGNARMIAASGFAHGVPLNEAPPDVAQVGYLGV
jgi:hypothetical protein